MPDDDRHTRDRVRTLDPVAGELSRRAREREVSDPPPEQLALPEDDVRPRSRARETLTTVVDNLGRPDLEGAAERVRGFAQRLERGEVPDVCAGYRTSGTQALLGQAVTTVLAVEDPGSLLERSPEELATEIGAEFTRAALRRYALDRTAPFNVEDPAGMGEALGFLELADLTFTMPFLRALADDVLR